MKKIAKDKWRHFYVGIPLGAALQAVALYVLHLKPVMAALLAFIVLLAICYGFELFSKITGKGHYEIPDVIAGVLGGIIGMAICLVVFWTEYVF